METKTAVQTGSPNHTPSCFAISFRMFFSSTPFSNSFQHGFFRYFHKFIKDAVVCPLRNVHHFCNEIFFFQMLCHVKEAVQIFFPHSPGNFFVAEKNTSHAVKMKRMEAAEFPQARRKRVRKSIPKRLAQTAGSFVFK